MTRIMVHLFLMWLAGSMLAVGCRCQDSAVLATMLEKQGNVDRDFAKTKEEWQTAKVGGSFYLGDAIRTKSASEAVLSLNEGSTLKLTEMSQIRFMMVQTKHGKSGQGIDVETGEAELMVGNADLSLFTSVGMATVASGSVLKLRRVDDGLAFEVEIGKATYFDKNNTANEVNAGETITVDIGSAVLESVAETPEEIAPKPDDTGALSSEKTEKVDTDTEDKATHSPPTKVPDKSSRENGPVLTIPDGPAKADFLVTPGTNFVVHSPAVPVVIGFNTAPKCPHGAAVQLGRGWDYKGDAVVHAKLNSGRHRYRIKCLEEAGGLGRDVARGHIQVLKDAGVAKIPGKPPTSFVETDGRRYKILYQTRQPKIQVKWLKAPKGQKYKLHIDGKKSISTTKPSYKLASGTLSEGEHQLKFEAIGSLARTSRTTTVEIRFDNAAPKASIAAPSNGGFGPGKVNVKGTAMARWTVKLLGGTLEKDAQHRFVGSTNYTGKYMSVTLRLSHPRRGVHYYIRRAQGQGL